MDNNLFDDLVASIKEAGAIKRNEMKESRGLSLNYQILKKYVRKQA